jgi:Leucine-rich repeat (LRR) protein
MICWAFAVNAQDVDSLCCQNDKRSQKAKDLETALQKSGVTTVDLSLQSPKLTKIPEELSALTELKCLNLSFNRIASFPESFKELTNLVCLDLSGNHYLQKLPAFLNDMPNLKVIRLQDLKWSEAKKKETEQAFPGIIFVW